MTRQCALRASPDEAVSLYSRLLMQKTHRNVPHAFQLETAPSVRAWQGRGSPFAPAKNSRTVTKTTPPRPGTLKLYRRSVSYQSFPSFASPHRRAQLPAAHLR